MILRAEAIAPTVALALLATTSHATADPTARLEVEYGPSAERCPSAKQLRDAVAERLGSDRLISPAPSTVIHVRFSHDEPRAWSATIRAVSADGRSLGRRALASKARTCDELGSDVALALAVALDSQDASPAPSARATATDDEPEGVAAWGDDAPPSAPPAEPPVPWHASFTVGPHVALGVAPALSVGLGAGAALRQRRVSFGIEGRADLPSSPSGDEPAARASLVAGTLLTCIDIFRAERAALYGCPLATAGVLYGDAVRVPRRRPRLPLSRCRSASPSFLCLGRSRRVSRRGPFGHLGHRLIRTLQGRYRVKVRWTSPREVHP